MGEGNFLTNRRVLPLTVLLGVGLLLLISEKHSALGQCTCQSYDFIVVGAGTAGCTLAARLSETGEHSVLLLEAGGYPNAGTEVPALAPQFIYSTDHAKHFSTVPQEYAGLENGGIVNYIIGRTLGGGSAINGMVWNRGHPNDWGLWADRVGDQSFNYTSMLKYFKQSENYKGNFPSDQHGYDGPITVSMPRYSPQKQTYFEAGKSLGYTRADSNGPQKPSFAPSETSKKKGRRVSSFVGYLRNVVGSRHNLKVTTHAYVKKIVFEGKRAVGVVYISKYNSTTGKGSEEVTVRANKEVIVSCGAIESPTLLLRSGIGPKEHLLQNGIVPVKDLPAVGQNLQDHTLIRFEFRINDSSNTFIAKRDLTEENYAYYNQTGDGPYSTLDGIFVQSFMISSIARRNEGSNAWPDLHLQFFSGPGVGISVAEKDRNAPGKTSVLCQMFLSRPESKGTVKLNSSNLMGDPLIDFRYLSEGSDLDVMVEGAKRVLEVYEKTEAYQRLGATFYAPPLPACQNERFRSDGYWRCYIMQRSVSGLHGTSTCSMGKGQIDKRAVVDTSFRVIGVTGLRLCDSSVPPRLLNANLEAPIYAISEKAAEIILAWYA